MAKRIILQGPEPAPTKLMNFYQKSILFVLICLSTSCLAGAEQKLFAQKFGGIELRLLDETKGANSEPSERLELQFPAEALKDVNHFMLEGPRRMVVDMTTEKKIAGLKFFPSKSKVAKTVRFGDHQGKFRMVLDLAANQKLQSEVKKDGDTLILRFGRSLDPAPERALQQVGEVPEERPKVAGQGISLAPKIVFPEPQLALLLPEPKVQGLGDPQELSEPKARFIPEKSRNKEIDRTNTLYSLDRETINFLVGAEPEQDLVLENLSDKSLDVTAIVTRASRGENDAGEELSEITIDPESFKLGARGYSLVRVRSDQLDPELEQVYKVNFLVQSIGQQDEQTEKLSGPSVLVFVKPSVPNPNLLSRREPGQIVLSNEGNVSILLDKVRVCSPANECTLLPTRRLFCGERWPIKAMANDTLEFLKKSEDRYEPVKLVP